MSICTFCQSTSNIRYSKLWVIQRILIYALVFTTSFILLSSLSIPLSYPILTTYTNGSSGLGPFGSTDPTYALPAFHFSGFTEDATSVVGVAPICDEGCFSYFLPGVLAAVNSSWYHLTMGIQGLDGTSFPLASLGMSQGDMGPFLSMMGILGGNNTDTSGAAFGALLAGILGGVNGAPGSQGLDLSGLLGGNTTGLDSLLSGLLGGGLGSLNLTDILGAGTSGDPLAGLLGGLKKRELIPRQADITGLASGLQQIGSNYINWADYAANQTKEYGTPELAYVTESSKGYRLDFSPFTDDWPQFNRYCANYTALLNLELIACVATDTDAQNVSSIVGGLRVCDPLNLFGKPCPTTGDIPMEYTTRMQISTARATTAFSLRNATILSIKDESASLDYPINVEDFFRAFTSPFQQSKLFAALELSNNNATSSVTSQLVLSLASDFAFAGEGPLSGTYQLRNMMAYAMTIGSLMQDEIENSGRQFVTKVAYTIRLSPVALYVYSILGGIIVSWCLSVLFWCSWTLTANASGFPEIDFATKWVAAGSVEGLSNGTSKSVVQKLGGPMRVYLGEGVREASEGERRAVVLDSVPVAGLKRGVVYS